MNRNMNISSIERVNRKLKEVSPFSRAKQRQGNVQKKCAARAKLVFFLLIRSIVVVFYRSRCFHPVSLVLLDFIFSLRKL